MDEESQVPAEQKSSRWPYLVVVAVLAAAGAGAYWWFSRPVELPKAPEPPPVVAEPPDAAAAPAMPSVGDADAMVRKLAGAISSARKFAEWLEAGDLSRRFVSTVNAIAEGDSPRASLPFLAPKQAFKAIQVKGQSFIDPKSYQRYDEFADVIASVDASAVAVAFAGLHPLLDSAYAEIGKPGTSFDAQLAKALHRLTAVPPPNAPVEVVAPVLAYKYVDASLEGQPAAAKHLLRMGPRNMSLVQAKLREVAAALKLPEPK